MASVNNLPSTNQPTFASKAKKKKKKKKKKEKKRKKEHHFPNVLKKI